MRKIFVLVGIVLLSLGSLCILCFFNLQTKATSAQIHPIASVTLSSGDTFEIELYPEYAPNTVNNFIYLVGKNFYSHTFITRVLPNYLIQAGDPIGNGYGFPGYFIKSECRYNGVNNKLKHVKGTVSMARSDKFNTEGCQFFILLKDDATLNGQYTAFGRVVKGLETLEQLAKKDVSAEKLKILSIQLNTFGETYEVPQILDPKTQAVQRNSSDQL